MDSGECGKMQTLAPPFTKSENLGKYLGFLFQNMPNFKVWMVGHSSGDCSEECMCVCDVCVYVFDATLHELHYIN